MCQSAPFSHLHESTPVAQKKKWMHSNHPKLTNPEPRTPQTGFISSTNSPKSGASVSSFRFSARKRSKMKRASTEQDFGGGFGV